jgi:hypothetical protein
MNGITLSVEAKIHPTEDPKKISKAMESIFGEVQVNKSGDKMITEINGFESLNHFHYILARDRIRNTFRRVLNRIKENNRINFGLNRQAAFAGHISFYHSKEAPLGPIEVEARGDIDTFIDFICK